MVTKVIGKVDGQEVIYERSEGDLWKVTVPLDLDGMYVIEVSAYDEAGNISFCTKNVVDRRSGYTMCKAYPTGLYGGGSFERI